MTITFLHPALISGRVYLAPLAPPAAADSLPPTMDGSVTVSAITSSGAHAAWQVATDNVAVAGYEISVDTGTPTWIDVGNVTARDITGLTASINRTVRVRAYDGATPRNYSDVITASLTTAAPVVVTPDALVTVPTSRTVKFAGRSRVVVFSGSKPVGYTKGPLDELYIVGDFSKDLTESNTTISSVSYVSAGVTVLVAPVLQSGFPVVKLGQLDLSAPRMYFTFRLTLVNSEQIDGTIELTALDDRKTFKKDPDDKRFYTLDFSSDATFGGTALQSVSAPVPVGVLSLSTPVVESNTARLKIGGLDTAEGATNSVGLWVNFANTERIFRTVYFTQEDH